MPLWEFQAGDIQREGQAGAPPVAPRLGCSCFRVWGECLAEWARPQQKSFLAAREGGAGIPLTINGEFPVGLCLFTDHGHSHTFSLYPGGQRGERLRASTGPFPLTASRQEVTEPPSLVPLASITTTAQKGPFRPFSTGRGTEHRNRPGHPDPIMMIPREGLATVHTLAQACRCVSV